MMFALIEGTLDQVGPPAVILCGGVGYEIWLPQRAHRRLPPAGSQVRVYTHMLAREDSWVLYGFPTLHERELFRMLITVSGVGPKVALAILGDEESGQALAAIRAGDVGRLTAIKGIGRKTAERLVLELRDRARELLPAPLAAVAVAGGEPEEAPVAAAGPQEEAVLALIAMGVPPDRARAAVAAVVAPAGANVGTIVRAALQRSGF